MENVVDFTIVRKAYNQDTFDAEYQYTHKSRSIKDFVNENMPSCSKESMKRAVFEYFPVCEWVPKYGLKDLTADLMAGFTVGIVSVPIAMALAALANIPEVIGLYTTCIPPFFFAFFSTSRHVSIGMFAVIALLVRSAEIRHLSENATIEFNQDMDIADLPSVQLLTTLTFTTGLVMFVMSIFRLHIIASYMSHSLIGGFTTAAAIHIMLSQVPPVLQLDLAKRSGLFKAIFEIYDIFSHIEETNVAVLILSIICISIMYTGKTYLSPWVKKFCPLPLPIESIVVIITAILSYVYNFNGKYNMKIVNHIPVGFPKPILPEFTKITDVLPDAIVIAIVIYAITFSLEKMMAKNHNYKVNPKQELRALAICQLLSCFFLCHPSSENLSRVKIGEDAGAKSQCVLSTIILVVLQGVLRQFSELINLWKISKTDFAIWLFSFLATILWDVSQGLVASVIFALFTIILQLQWASIAKLRRIGETEIYRNPELYLLSSSNPEIVIFSFNAPLMFLNSEQFKENMINHICEIEKESIIPRYLVLDASQISKCDKTGVLILEELSNELSRNYAITMLLASCSEQLRGMCEACGIYRHIPSNFFFPTIHDAVLWADEKPKLKFIEVDKL